MMTCLKGNDVAYDWTSDVAIVGPEDTWHYLIGADIFIFAMLALSVNVSNSKGTEGHIVTFKFNSEI